MRRFSARNKTPYAVWMKFSGKKLQTFTKTTEISVKNGIPAGPARPGKRKSRTADFCVRIYIFRNLFKHAMPVHNGIARAAEIRC